ncbi:AAA family ATPase [Xylophilus sp. GOD-11R]|uniref:AAA family ATPase n=1 Tax=Xylophilus sp. GOD-11R TaxID=3089814 RepID=UPI00298CE1C3|nr:AAA family ATPase [Xylophilus sp. GOD-11R]WPB58994.1 AAA family ATPase [Xylophilus sp. GOD-11R]
MTAAGAADGACRRAPSVPRGSTEPGGIAASTLDRPAVVLRPADGGALHRLAAPPGEAALLLATCNVGPQQAAARQRLEQTWSLRHRLDPGFASVPLQWVQRDGLPALVLSDPGGELLHGMLGRPMPTAAWLALGIEIARAIGDMHARGVVHQAIRPHNILVSRPGRAFLTGFGSACLSGQGEPPIEPAAGSADAMPYMSPEQTGRLNRAIDARSDLYSFGVTLFQMATGVLPFYAADAVEWVHCHVAREPPSPRLLAPGLPPVVTSIVLRLLRKAPEERYQSAAGVEADLRRCARELAEIGAVGEFALAECDVPERLVIAERLYGRERDLDRLLHAYRGVADTGAPALALISGYSGIGKSAVMSELRKTLAAEQVTFAVGKFDQHQRDIPYATIAQALQGLVAQVLGQDADRLAVWRRELQAAVCAHGQIAIGLVPELQHVIGPQPALPEVSAVESTLRFQKTIRRFLAAFARADRPLVLFIDDLQWLDTATLDLLAAMVTSPDFRHVLLIGAYRSNEVGLWHPLAAMLSVLRDTGVPLLELPLQALSVRDLEALVARTLHDEGSRSAALARLIWEKTQGNPFFAIQFIVALGDEQLLWFERESQRWVWNLAGIRARNYSDNVADLMAEKLQRLPEPTRAQLMLLACLGASASLATLSRVSSLESGELHARFAPAELAGLVSRSAAGYRFMHDRIQEAAYEAIPEPRRAGLHLQIAQGMRRGREGAELDALLFELVAQYACAEALLVSDLDRLDVAGLHLAAARRAMVETAYRAANGLLATAQRLLPGHAWEIDFRLAFDIERTRAECEFLVGEPAAADQRLAALAPRASSLLDKAGVTALQVTVCLGLDQSARAIDVALGFLHDSGMPWPLRPGPQEVEREYGRLVELIGARQIESLLELPATTDPLRRAMLDVLAAMLPPAFFTDENLVCLVLCRMVRLSIEYGATDASPLAYAYLGMMLGPYFHDFPSGYRFGKLGFDLVERGAHPRYKARVHMCFAYHVLPWTRDIRSGHGLLRRAFQIARDSGDIAYAGFSSCCLVSTLLASGEPLDSVGRESQERLDFVTAARFGLIVDIITAQRRLVATLQGRTETLGCFDGEGFDEVEFERHLQANRSLDIAACWYWIRKAQARFLAGDAAAALHALDRAAPLLWTTKGHLEFAEYHLHRGLVHAACHQAADEQERESHRAALVAQRSLLDDWARHSPDNFRGAAALLAAEQARINGDDMDAMRHYEAAIEAARSAGFVHHEAMAYELAARFHASRGLHVIAGAMVRAARLAYDRWGATGKVRQLESLHRLPPEFAATSADETAPRLLGEIEVETALRASQAVATEKGLARLMRTLMTLALEHAGADRGLLLLPRCGSWRIEARATTRRQAVDVVLRSAEAGADDLPLTLMNYAARTRSPVLIDDARAPGPFADDAYFVQSPARSVLCLPLLRQGELNGLLYLENRLATRVFTPRRVAMLTLLASTAATSMENATLEEKESLLQEVHHRVKNNLQLISSLLSLQASRIADPKVVELFTESRNRVRSMALVHENLYRAGNFARVPMAQHLQNLCGQLARAYGAHERGVRLRATVDDIHLSLDRAVSCGLIVNELVSNALKHAFSDRSAGEVQVALRAAPDGRHALTVSDDGVGLPAHIDWARAGSLGLQLVDDLAQQLHGEVDARRGQGTTFVITFAADPEPAATA